MMSTSVNCIEGIRKDTEIVDEIVDEEQRCFFLKDKEFWHGLL